MASPAPSTVDISDDDDAEVETPKNDSGVVDGCDEGQPVEHVPEPSELDVDEGEVDKDSASPSVGNFQRGKSHVFDFVPQPQDSQDPNTPEASMEIEIDHEEEKRIAEDKKLPLHPLPKDEYIAELKEKINNLRKEQGDLKSRRLARKAALEAAADKVINVDESLPYGRDTAETMDMGDVDDLMQKFNRVEKDLELETTDDSPATCSIKLCATFFVCTKCWFQFFLRHFTSKLDA